MSDIFCKICLHHQALYETNNVTEFTSATSAKELKIKNYFKINRHKSTSQLVQLLAAKIIT